MELLSAFIFSLALSVDSFSAAFGLGFRPHTRKEALAFALSSGLSEGLLALIGLYFGKYIVAHFAAYDHWIAFVLLFVVGLRLFWEALRAKKPEAPQSFHRPAKILLISFATSLDALGVGMGLGIVGKPILLYSPLIALFAFLSTLLGLKLAQRLGSNFGPKIEAIGGIVLMGLAFQMLKI
mgnify:CR=1 FL=1